MPRPVRAQAVAIDRKKETGFGFLLDDERRSTGCDRTDVTYVESLLDVLGGGGLVEREADQALIELADVDFVPGEQLEPLVSAPVRPSQQKHRRRPTD